MRLFMFSKRCAKEILRDPINLLFGLAFPIVLLLLLFAIGENVPADIFTLEILTPGIAVFGLSFMTLFSATLISRDRESSFMEMLYTTPLRAVDFIAGYMLPLIPMALCQCALSYLCAMALGLTVSWNILPALLLTLPVAVLYIALGLLFGSILTVKQVGGICGALLTNLSVWLSGAWFDLKLIGGVFLKIAECLPFLHAVESARAALAGDMGAALLHALPVLLYAIAALSLAIFLFLRQMKKR